MRSPHPPPHVQTPSMMTQPELHALVGGSPSCDMGVLASSLAGAVVADAPQAPRAVRPATVTTRVRRRAMVIGGFMERSCSGGASYVCGARRRHRYAT